MCLGIPGRIVAFLDTSPDLAAVDVAGVTRQINIALIDRAALHAGDWVLIHAGFAMDKIDADTAALQLSALQDYTGPGATDVQSDAGSVASDVTGRRRAG